MEGFIWSDKPTIKGLGDPRQKGPQANFKWLFKFWQSEQGAGEHVCFPLTSLNTGLYFLWLADTRLQVMIMLLHVSWMAK